MPAKKFVIIIRRFLGTVIAVGLLASGVFAYSHFMENKPQMKRARPTAKPTVVDVASARIGQAQVVVKAMGSVVPSREVSLKARVSGQVMELSPNFTPGGRVSKGEKLIQLDRDDYLIALKKAKSALDKAQADLKIEQGSQEIARAELKLMRQASKNPVQETALALRKPQLEQAKAGVASARADLEQARLNLNRTEIKAPFNGLITKRQVVPGSQVNSQDAVGTIVCTDEYWIEAVVPLDRLRRLGLNQPGGRPVEIRSLGDGAVWSGRTLRSTGVLNAESRMAAVIIAVPDPLGLKSESARPALMLDDYVSVSIQGRIIDHVIELPRSALRDDGSVWVLTGGKLEVRRVELAWKENDRVFVSAGLEPGESIVTSDLAVSAPGMKLTTAAQADRLEREQPVERPDGAGRPAKGGAGRATEPGPGKDSGAQAARKG